MGVRVVFPDMGKDPSIQLIEKTITENGTYDALTDGANGYSKVNVNVEGGGGSSDFSTAQVTVIKEEESLNGLILPTISDDTYEIQPYQSGIYTVPLYKGSLFIKGAPILGIIESVSGDIEELGSGKNNYYRIYGDCTITIS